MGLENVRLRLAANAEVAEVAEVFRSPSRACATAEAEVAEVAEVFGGRKASVRKSDVHRLQRSCRGFSQTYAPATHRQCSTSEGRAEVAEVSHSFTRAQAHARARARGEERGRAPVQPLQPLRAPVPATILRHCRCSDCLNFSCVAGEYFCSEYIGGMAVVWATGERFCDPPPDAWHYCARYRGPQVSKDVFVWPKSHVGARERPAPGGGGPSGGPLRPEPIGEDRSNRHHLTTPPPGSIAPSAPATRRAAQVGAGSNISGEGDGEADRAQIVRQIRMYEC